MKIRSKITFNIFTLVALLASLLGSAVFVPSVQAVESTDLKPSTSLNSADWAQVKALLPAGVVPNTQQAYLKASNTEESDLFGNAMSVSGDTLAIGAYKEDSNATGVNGNQADNSATDSGAVYIFTRAGGVWTQQAYLKASNTEAGDYFGWDVSLFGDTLVVTARYEDSNATGVNGNQTDNSAANSGAAYVFTRTAGVWSQQAYLKASNTEAGDEFGAHVSISDDTIIVGALFEDSNAVGINGDEVNNLNTDSGAAYVFTRTAGVWSQQAYLKASNTEAGDWFGFDVSVSGDTLAVGSLEDSNATGVNSNQADNSATDSGAVYVFTRTINVWSQQAYLKASNTETNDGFGLALSLSGDTLVVGADSERSNATGVNGNQGDNSSTAAGAAYVFTRTGVTWSQQAYLKASNTEAFDTFGSSVGVSGDMIVVGATGEDSNAVGIDGNQADNSASNSGAAYIFTRSGTTWTQQTYFKASNTEANDVFGRSVSISGDLIVVGASAEDSNATGINGNQFNNSAAGSGAAYVFAPLHASGDFLWAKSMGGAFEDYGSDITVDSNGNVYTTGVFSDTVDFDPGADVTNLTSAGAGDIFVSKLDDNGSFVWAKNMGGAGNDYGRSIAVDSSGNIYTLGDFWDTGDFDPGIGISNLTRNGSYSDIFISKLDSSGNFVWAKSMGGLNIELGFSIAIDSNDNIYITGNYEGTADFDPGASIVNLTSIGQQDIFVSKLDSDGNFVWAKSMGGTAYDQGNDIAVDSNNNIYMTGFFRNTVDFDSSAGSTNLTSAGEADVFVFKLDSSGNFVWVKSMGGASTDSGNGIAVDSSGNIYTTGIFQGPADFDPGAGTANLTFLGNFISKLDTNGNFIWAKKIGGSEANSITLDLSNNVYTTGSFVGNDDFDPSEGVSNLTNAGGHDIFVSKLDSLGNFVWAKSMGGTSDDYGKSIAIDSSGNVHTQGYYYSATADFDPGTGTANLNRAGGSDIFISKLKNDGVAPAVTSFTATSPSTSLNIPITAFTASDAEGVAGYMITTSSTPPAVGDVGWAGTVPAVYTVITDGNYTLYPWAKDAAGNISTVFAPASVTVDATAPTVSSSLRASTSPSALPSVNFTVTFSESVTGVDTSDFNLTTTGVSGATVSGISGTGSLYTVSVNTGSSNGTIRLNVLNDGSIKDITLNPLGSAFNNGEVYTISKPATFSDVSLTYWASSYIERLYHAGITGGCGTGIYCPDAQ